MKRPDRDVEQGQLPASLASGRADAAPMPVAQPTTSKRRASLV